MKLIPYVGLIINFCEKSDYPQCANPSLSDVATRIEFLDRRCPVIHRRVTKRDIVDASKRAPAHPYFSAILCVEFEGSDLGPPGDIVFMWTVLLFGWSAAPGYFQCCARLISLLHCLHKPVSPITGARTFSSHMYVDDVMVVEVDLPQRFAQSADVVANCCNMVLGASEVREREKKKKIEGNGFRGGFS